MPAQRVALVTGFEPFAGYRVNPSAEIARALDGAVVGGTRIVGRVLPVDLGRLDRSLRKALGGLDPAVVIALGLAAGEPVIRLERVAVNLADFEIADNAGRRASERALTPGGAAALNARLPLRAIQCALLDQGIPARLSNSAGTYLCNAALYRMLEMLPARVGCGFVHLPALPAEVARRIATRPGASSETALAQLASMDLATMRRAVEIALVTALGGPVPGRRRKPSPRA